jgi:hypothetical protein
VPLFNWRPDPSQRWVAVLLHVPGVAISLWFIWKVAGQLGRVPNLQFSLLRKSLMAGWLVSSLGFAVSLLVLAAFSRSEVIPSFERGGFWSFVLGPRPQDAGRARFWFRMRVLFTFFGAGIVAMILMAAADLTGFTH